MFKRSADKLSALLLAGKPGVRVGVNPEKARRGAGGAHASAHACGALVAVVAASACCHLASAQPRLTRSVRRRRPRRGRAAA